MREKFFRDCDSGVRDVVSQQELRQLTSSQVQQLWMVDLKTGGTQYVSDQDLTHLDAMSAGKKRVFDGGRINAEDRARINKQSRDARYAERSTLAAAKQMRISSERAAQVSVTFQGNGATHQGRTRTHTWTGPRSANGGGVSISRGELLGIASTVLDGQEKQFRVLVPSGQGYEEVDAATGLHDIPPPARGAPPIIVQEIDPVLRDAIVDSAPIDSFELSEPAFVAARAEEAMHQAVRTGDSSSFVENVRRLLREDIYAPAVVNVYRPSGYYEDFLEEAAPAIRASTDAMREAISLNPRNLRFAGPQVRRDPLVVAHAIQVTAFEFLAFHERGIFEETDPFDRDVQALGAPLHHAHQDVVATRDLAMRLVAKVVRFFPSITEHELMQRWRGDAEIMLMVVRSNPRGFRSVDESLLDDAAFVRRAVQSAPQTLRFAPARIQRDKSLALCALAQGADVLRWNRYVVRFILTCHTSNPGCS